MKEITIKLKKDLFKYILKENSRLRSINKSGIKSNILVNILLNTPAFTNVVSSFITSFNRNCKVLTDDVYEFIYFISIYKYTYNNDKDDIRLLSNKSDRVNKGKYIYNHKL